MNNNASPEKKDSVLKSLAIAGFISIIVLIAWLSIQVVSVLPGAFSSLASLAEGLNQYKESVVQNNSDSKVDIIVTSNTTLLNSGESVELSWGETKTPGTYTFSYACAEGVAIDINNVDGLQSIACDTNYNVGNTNTVTLTIDSEKNRFSDVGYTVSFLKTNDTAPRASGSAAITVINSKISEGVAIEEVQPEPEETEDSATTPEVTTPVTPKPTPTYEQEYVYTIPTSNPNGRTDLSTGFINVGRIVGNTFFPEVLKQQEIGAIQFEVKNYGTKTSTVWTYSVSLPNGATYTSDNQVALKPNERAVITVGFPVVEKTNHTFVVRVAEATDQNQINNQFSKTVQFVK